MESPSSNEGYLAHLADQAMVAFGLEPAFPPDALKQLKSFSGPAHDASGREKDMRGMLWCSIDNDDSRDLDQISVGEDLGGSRTRLWVAVADVDALVSEDTPLDLHAQKNTTSVYTGVKTFPMLPEKLSTDLTSLNQEEERLAVVIEMDVEADGSISQSSVYRARVTNKSKLAYKSVSAWLEKKGPLPLAAQQVKGMDAQLRLQDAAAQRLRARRHEAGALELRTIQTRPVTENGQVVDLQHEEQTRAGELIEDLMVAANGITAKFLTRKGFPTLRRVVKTPERWDRIVALAAERGTKLPASPDSKALNNFLQNQKAKDPLRFPDLSLTVVKLLGRGEYVLDKPGESTQGHFGLAVKDYNHSTAPNRRYPDLITQRLLKAALKSAASPYSLQDLNSLAAHCTQQENAADKVERQMRKSASALFLSKRVGETFDALVTGASPKGIWVRLIQPPVEGFLAQGGKDLDVGDRVRVKLIGVSVEKGWIDFAKISGGPA
jgi:exoribonuclease-2